jgi:hypothetical protein
MTPHRSFARADLIRALVYLALPALPLASHGVEAQQQVSASADAEYRLTMPVLRRALPVLYTPRAKTECAKSLEQFRDVRAMSVAEMEKLLSECPPIQKAAAAQGISSRELAQVSKALTSTAHRMAEEESAKASGGSAAPLPPGALRDNVALVRQNEAELGRLTGR